ncbi:methyltransferase domain-containing protein [Streptomyces sp. NPDC051976]|uniref:class I SAM-dependent methyltransferase n=1 Tax=Streptomyces sp. NPDC051976 TaxID=3154947 RepID=UPI0034355EE1
MDRKRRAAARYDDMARTYDRAGPPFYALAGAALVRRLGLAAGMSVLDAGCGRGACLFPLAGAVGPTGRAAGVDISPVMVRETAAEAAGLGLTQATVTVGDAEAPDFPDASFDAVTSSFVLPQLPDPQAALHAYARLLRPGGMLAVARFVPGFHPDWQAVDAALEPFAPAARPSDDVDPPSLAAAAGFREVTDEELAVLVTLPDPASWWDYLWGSVYRGRVADIPDADLPAARAATLAATEPLRAEDGTLTMSIRFRCTTATRP